MCVCACVCVCVDELNYTCHCSGAYNTHISSKVMLISMFGLKNNLSKISIPLGSVIPIYF